MINLKNGLLLVALLIGSWTGMSGQSHKWELTSGIMFADKIEIPGETFVRRVPPLTNFNVGMTYLISQEKNYSFRAGISWLSYGSYSRKNDFINIDTTFVLPNGTLIEYPATITAYVRKHFVELPMVTKYQWQKGRFTPFIHLDIVPQFYVQDRGVQESDREIFNFNWKEKDPDTRKLNIALGTGIGTYYKLSEKLSLIANIFTRGQILSNNSIRSKNYLFGFGMELSVKF
jgi:hypothetical protein